MNDANFLNFKVEFLEVEHPDNGEHYIQFKVDDAIVGTLPIIDLVEPTPPERDEFLQSVVALYSAGLQEGMKQRKVIQAGVELKHKGKRLDS